jgi:hypothetical protein
MPEGTRGKDDPAKRWRSGFYHIARGAAGPLVMVVFDYGNRQVRVGPAVYAGAITRPSCRRSSRILRGWWGGIRRGCWNWGEHRREVVPPPEETEILRRNAVSTGLRIAETFLRILLTSQ